MLPAQRNKVDISKLTPAEQQAFRLYGKLPSRPVSKSQERKYFDSGDFALAKAGKAGHHDVGKVIPRAEEIPHASPTPIGLGGSANSASSGSPPTGTPILSPPTGAGPGSPGSTGAIPIGVSGGQPFGSESNSINLSMSPGRVGVGQPLATSPTRGFGGFGHSTSPTSSLHYSPGSGSSGQSSNPLINRLEREASHLGAVPSPIGLSATPAQVAGTTGNQIGKVHIRRTSQSEGSNLNPASPPTSSLANSVIPHESTEDENVDGMELQ